MSVEKPDYPFELELISVTGDTAEWLAWIPDPMYLFGDYSTKRIFSKKGKIVK